MTFAVVFEPDDGGWHVHVPSLQGCRTWGRSLNEARNNIREAISLQEEAMVDADTVARTALFEEDIRVDASVRALLELSEVARAVAEAEAAQARALSAAAAHALTDARLSLRDAGELLGVSQEGVRKMLRAPRATLDPRLADFAAEVKSGVAYYEVKRARASELRVTKAPVTASGPARRARPRGARASGRGR